MLNEITKEMDGLNTYKIKSQLVLTQNTEILNQLEKKANEKDLEKYFKYLIIV